MSAARMRERCGPGRVPLVYGEAALAAPPCGTCTIRLVTLAYERAPWFRLVREPLRVGMLALSRLHGIDASAYAVRTEACRGCLRFQKAVLKDRSVLFRVLNRVVNPVFDALLVRIVGPAAVREAKEHARRATTSAEDAASSRDALRVESESRTPLR